MIASVLHELLLQRLERDGGKPLSRQVYEAFSALILQGDLRAGTKLPASRVLARDMGLSRNTIIAAYEQLNAEGYVITITGSGTFVSDTVPVMVGQVMPLDAELVQPVTGDGLLSDRGSALVSTAQASRHQWGPFIPGVPDVTMFPSKVWMRLQRRYWREPIPSLMTYAHGAGYKPLRRALSEHLRLARSVQCDPEQVVITSGIHQSLDLIAKLLGDEDCLAWMENPGYWGASTVLTSAGIQLRSINVDDEGMSPTPEQMQQDVPKFIFVTPSHQYPLGNVMSLARRRMLLEYANQCGAWIIEDDYDSEFRFGGRPIASLQGLDSYERVIYLGTFSKTLFPSMRMGFMVLPKAIARAASVALSELYREGRLMEQAVLADFIAEGHYAAHIRKMKAVYARRQTLLRDAISEHFGPQWPLSNQEAGLHLVMHLPEGTDDEAITKAAHEAGIWVRPLTRYYAGEHKSPGLLFGYAAVGNEEDIRPAFAQLAELIKAAL